MIKGVKTKPLKMFGDEKGKVMHMMKCTDDSFKKFGEVYFSVAFPGIIKGWHKQKKATRNYAVVEGNIQLVIYDGKEFQEFFIGEDNYYLVTIPPGVWSAFKAIGNKKAIVADLTDLPHNPQESEKADISSFSYKWGGGS